uniref:DUF5683 domain-containing protein n=1 Tax=candidate division WOR-3 bacterium TaxID=2052148 RepID=A0A7C3URJ7_UNCW3
MKNLTASKLMIFLLIFVPILFADLPKGINLISSALLPGSGELLLREKIRGELFLLTDGLLWLSFFSARSLGNFINQDAILFSAEHAGANGEKRDDDYYKYLEEYNSADEFNEIILREARNRYPDDPEKQKEYLKKYGYFGEDAWSWESDSARIRYWRMRRRARAHYLRAKFFFAGNLLLRVISVFDVSFLLDKKKRLSYELQVIPETRIGLNYRF